MVSRLYAFILGYRNIRIAIALDNSGFDELHREK
jgi:hypothetical protein